MRSISIRIENKAKDKATFQNRHDLRQGHVPNYVLQDKSHLNSVLISPISYGALKSICDNRRSLKETKRKIKSNVAVATVGIITFSKEAQKVIEDLGVEEQNTIFTDVAKAIAERLDNEITGLTVHRDESAIHAHFQMPGYSKSGMPTSKIVTPKLASELQDIAGACVEKYEIERGIKKIERIRNGEDLKKIIHRTVAQLHEDLPSEIEKLKKDLEDGMAKLAKQKILIMQKNTMLLHLDKEAEAKIEQARKTLQVYQKKEADAIENIKKLDAEIDAATKVLEGLDPSLAFPPLVLSH